MKFMSIAYALLISATFCAYSVQGLECFSCNHIDGIVKEVEGINIHNSCKQGRKPDEKFSMNCSEGFDSCGKLYFDGKTAITGDTIIKFTMRGCFPTIPTLNDTCEDVEMEGVQGILGVSSEMYIMMVKAIGGATVSMCQCKSDNCNSTSTVKISNILLLLAFTFFASKVSQK